MNANIFFYVFIIPSLIIPTFFLILISFFILTKLSHESPMFAYQKIELFFILIDMLIDFNFPLVKCENCNFDFGAIFSYILNIVLIDNLTNVLEMSSCLMAIMVVLSCNAMLDATNKNYFYSFLFRLNPYLLGLIAFLLANFNFSYQYLESQVQVSQTNSTSKYFIETTNFGESTANVILTIVSYGISNFIIILSLVVINFLTLIKLKNKLKAKSSTSRQKMEKKMTILILVDSFVFILGRVPLFIYFIFDILNLINYDQFPFSGLISVLIIGSFISKFFIFYFLNKRFQTEVKLILLKIKRKFV